MRIRKHLSGLNLPAVCNPVFRREPDGNKSSSSNKSSNEDMITTGVPGGGGGGGSSSTAAAAAGSSGSSQELEVAAAAAAPGQGEMATTRIFRCRTGVLKVYSSSSRSLANNATTTTTSNTANNNNNNDSSSASSLLTAAAAAAAAGFGGATHNGAAPPTPTPPAARPKRAKPANAGLVKPDDCMQEFQAEFQQQFHSNPLPEPDAEPEQQQQHRRVPLVEHIFSVIQDVGSLKQQSSASAAVEVPMQAEEIPIERDLLLPMSKSHHGNQPVSLSRRLSTTSEVDGLPAPERHDEAAATRQAQRTRSVRKLDAVDPSSDDVNQCRRRDGKGWRCHRRTQPAYSLCEYHLDKSRETHQRKLRSTGGGGGAAAAAASGAAGEPKRKYVRRKPVKARSLMSI